jgi:ABC-type oligopeptide transport system substrate-binding subunit
MMMEEWNHQSNIVLVPNPNWNGDEVAIDRIELAMINDPAASLAAYDNDELDVTGVPSADVARIRDDPQYADQILEGDRLAVSYYGFDLKNPDGPFTNSVLLRKAFNEALDKEVLVQTVFGGVGTVAHSLVPPGMPGHQEDEFIPFDTDQAKADFDQALNDLGITADDLQLQLGYNVAGSNEDQAVFFQEQWRSTFGIEVELVATEDFGSYLDILNDDPYDIFRLGWGADYPHPNNFLTDLISCTSTNNNMGYCNEEVDQLLEQAAAEPTLETQVPLYNQAQEMVMADAPIIPQLFSQAFTLVKPWVQGFTPTAQDSNSGELFYYKTSIAAH